MKIKGYVFYRYLLLLIILFGLSVVGLFMLRNHAVEAYAYTADLREVWVTDIQAEEEHQYDGTCEIQLFGGKLVDESGTEIEDESLSFNLGVGLIESPNVACNIPIETNIILLGDSASLYHLNQPTDLITSVIPATISITNISVEDKTYDGNTDASIIGYDINGIVGDDDVKTTKGIAKFDDKNVGNNKTVTFSDFSISGGDAGNYTIIQPDPVVATIIAKTICIENISVENKEYDGNDIANIIDYDVNGIIEGDSVEVTKGTARFNNKNVGDNKTVNFSDFSIQGSDAGNYILRQPNSLTASIQAKLVSIDGVSVANKEYDGTTKTTILETGLINGKIDGDEVIINYGVGVFESKNVKDGITVWFSGFSLSGTDAQNYELSSQPSSVNANISLKTITIVNVVALNENEKSNEIRLRGGQLDGIILGDDVDFILGSGSIDNYKVGKHSVHTNILLIGDDAGNYLLVQPTDIEVEIYGAISLSALITIAVFMGFFFLALIVIILLYFVWVRPRQLAKVTELATTCEKLQQDAEELQGNKRELVRENRQLKEKLAVRPSEHPVIPNTNEIIDRLKQEVSDAEGLASYYKKQLEKLQQAPDVKTAVKGLLPLITAMFDYTHIALSDREQYVLMQTQRIIDYLSSQHITIICSKEGDVYDPIIHSSQGSMPAPTEALKGTVQASACCGVKFDDGTIEKEQVILYL